MSDTACGPSAAAPAAGKRPAEAGASDGIPTPSPTPSPTPIPQTKPNSPTPAPSPPAPSSPTSAELPAAAAAQPAAPPTTAAPRGRRRDEPPAAACRTCGGAALGDVVRKTSGKDAGPASLGRVVGERHVHHLRVQSLHGRQPIWSWQACSNYSRPVPPPADPEAARPDAAADGGAPDSSVCVSSSAAFPALELAAAPTLDLSPLATLDALLPLLHTAPTGANLDDSGLGGGEESEPEPEEEESDSTVAAAAPSAQRHGIAEGENRDHDHDHDIDGSDASASHAGRKALKVLTWNVKDCAADVAAVDWQLRLDNLLATLVAELPDICVIQELRAPGVAGNESGHAAFADLLRGLQERGHPAYCGLVSDQCTSNLASRRPECYGLLWRSDRLGSSVRTHLVTNVFDTAGLLGFLQPLDRPEAASSTTATTAAQVLQRAQRIWAAYTNDGRSGDVNEQTFERAPWLVAFPGLTLATMHLATLGKNRSKAFQICAEASFLQHLALAASLLSADGQCAPLVLLGDTNLDEDSARRLWNQPVAVSAGGEGEGEGEGELEHGAGADTAGSHPRVDEGKHLAPARDVFHAAYARAIPSHCNTSLFPYMGSERPAHNDEIWVSRGVELKAAAVVRPPPGFFAALDDLVDSPEISTETPDFIAVNSSKLSARRGLLWSDHRPCTATLWL